MGGGRAHPADAALADLLAHDAGPDFPRLRPRPRRSLAAIPAVLILAGLVAGSLLALVARRPPPVEEERAASVAPGLAGLTAVGPPVALSAFPTGVRERLSGVSDGRGVELLTTRAGRSFFRARSSLGTCYLVANGAAPLIEPLAAACADGSLPAAARLVDLSPYSVRAGRPVLEAVGGGVAADGVAAVAVLDAAGRTLLRIDVVDNVCTPRGGPGR